jgi:aldose 1-epimerase
MTRLHATVLRSEVMEVVILPEVGGRIHRIRAFGQDILRTPDDPAMHVVEPFLWGAYVMAPWCNRATPGRMVLAGREVTLAANFPDGTAIHGLVSSARWVQRSSGNLAYVGGGGRDGWPWAFEVSETASLTGATLTLECRVRNLDDAPMPAGIGLHPWFRRPVELRVPAEAVYSTNSQSAPDPATVTGARDLRSLAPPADGLDDTWTQLTEPRVELTWPASGVQAILEVETDGGGLLVAVASPPAIDAIAVEPQTHGPDPLRRLALGEPDPPVLLPPGASVRLALRLTISHHGELTS